MNDETIAFIVRETGWTLEYIRSLPVSQFSALLEELGYLAQLEQYSHAHDAALIVCTLANSKTHQYKPEDIIGEPLERRRKDMPDTLGTTPEIRKVTLADGNEYEADQITVNTFCDMETKFGQPIAQIFDGRITPVRHLFFLLLKNKAPELTEESMGALITPEILGEMRKLIGV